MSKKSTKVPERRALENATSQHSADLRDIEYYMDNKGTDTQVIRDIAVSALIPRAKGDRKIQHVAGDSLYDFPFFSDSIDGGTEMETDSPFWSFTMLIRDGGEHKLLFSSQEDAEKIFMEVLHEQDSFYLKRTWAKPTKIAH